MKQLKKSGILCSMLLFCSADISAFNRRRACHKPCTAYQVAAPECCARNIGRFNPYYYVYQGYFRTYNWRFTPLNINRLMGPQAFMGPTA